MNCTSNRAISLDGAKCMSVRARKGFSRERLADESRGGLSIATIKRLEKGVPVYFDTARRLAALLEVPLAELVSDPSAIATTPGVSDLTTAPATVALLPFEVMGTDGDSRFFADGLVEDLITRMGRQWFPVISRGSTFRYVEYRPDPQKLRAELGVDYLVEGSVRRAGDTVRVTARLIDARTATQLWGNSYDRQYGDIFALQDALVSTIVRQVGGAILEKEVQDRRRRDPKDLTAWELALRASWYFHRRTKDTNTEARSLFEEALRRERALPLAWYGLAMTHQRAILNQWSTEPGRSLHAMKQVCAEYVREYPEEPGLHVATAYTMVYSGDHRSAMSRLREAIEIDPNATTAYGLYGQTLAMDSQPDEAIEQFELAMRLSPRDSDLWVIHTGIALCHFVGERYEAMLQSAEHAAGTHPDVPFPYGMIAVANACLGDDDGARSAVRRMLALEPNTSLQGLSAIVAAVNPDIVKRYAEALRRAGVPR
jgi:TolB-like protein/predicted Zn-dependent protease